VPAIVPETSGVLCRVWQSAATNTDTKLFEWGVDCARCEVVHAGTRVSDLQHMLQKWMQCVDSVGAVSQFSPPQNIGKIRLVIPSLTKRLQRARLAMTGITPPEGLPDW
jgi:hypothetical protein